ncbi:MAG: hypothetical protein S4CHLAM2_04790 [Chlamydiales bacterium]|nr:hypothetical protein [Chlamydiales bacterium]
MRKDPDKTPDFWNGLKEAVWGLRVEIFAGVLLLVGLILSFFYFRIGGALVGLGFGICFFEEMHQYFIQLRDIYVEHGLFRSVMLVGVVIYFLITIPSFVVAAAVGYGAMYLIRWIVKK